MTAALVALLLSGVPPLVAVKTLIPDLVEDLRYATPDNFLKHAVYPPTARCLLRRPVAERLKKVADTLKDKGYRLKVFDCYRPHSVQVEMWSIYPHEGYVANPAKGSEHNRGSAVDLTLVTTAGGAVEMPTPFDSFSRRAHQDDTSSSEVAQRNRGILRHAMQEAGFTINPKEWWHYSAPESRRYPVSDEPLR